jgi:hypothetical protein
MSLNPLNKFNAKNQMYTAKKIRTCQGTDQSHSKCQTLFGLHYMLNDYLRFVIWQDKTLYKARLHVFPLGNRFKA